MSLGQGSVYKEVRITSLDKMRSRPSPLVLELVEYIKGLLLLIRHILLIKEIIHVLRLQQTLAEFEKNHR